MNILSELNSLLENLKIPFETGHYSGIPPNEYIVIIPMTDSFELYADNTPQNEVQEARLSLYSKSNYYKLRNRLTKALLKADFTITDRRYIGFEADEKLHHYVIDVLKQYELEPEPVDVEEE